MEALKEAKRRKLIKEKTYEKYTHIETPIPPESEISAEPEISGINIISGPEIPKVDISSLLSEIEAKKQAKMEEMLSGISNDIELPHYEQKTEKPLVTISFDKITEPLGRFFSTAHNRSYEIMWPRWLYINWKKISLLGILMVFLSIIIIFVQEDYQTDLFLELFFLGIVIAVAGYSLSWKKERKIFSWLSIPYFLGLFMSLWAVITLFQFFNIYRFEEELQNIALAYITGILLMLCDTLIIKIQKIRNTSG